MTKHECNRKCDIKDVAMFQGDSMHHLDCPVWQTIVRRPEVVIEAQRQHIKRNPTTIEKLFTMVAVVSGVLALAFFMVLLFGWIGWIE